MNSMVYAAFLRGINVGGNTPVSMAQLKVCFEQLGFSEVKTYINSGNVIFKAGETDQRKLETQIEAALDRTFSPNIKVVVLNFHELKRVTDKLPASWAVETDKKCNVIFLRHAIDDPKVINEFSPKPDIEELYYQPGVLFWSASVDGLTRSNMIKLSSSPLYKDMTVRNLNTTRKVYALMRQVAEG